MVEHKKFEKIIPVGKKDFAYQCENVDTICAIRGSIPRGGGVQGYLNDEKDRIKGYELRIQKFTGNSLTVTLTKFRSDIRKQRERQGYAITEEKYQIGMDFAELVNQIFRGKEAMELFTEEHFPPEVCKEMKRAYKDK